MVPPTQKGQIGSRVWLTTLVERNDVVELFAEPLTAGAILDPGTERVALDRLLTSHRPELRLLRAIDEKCGGGIVVAIVSPAITADAHADPALRLYKVVLDVIYEVP